jgi:hypothetical protein
VIEGTSFAIRDKKYIVLSFNKGEDLVTLQFDKHGVAQKVAQFEDIQIDIRDKIIENPESFKALAKYWRV